MAVSALVVTSVSVPGTALQVNLGTQVGRPYDSATVERDVKYLWGLGRFEDVRVEAKENPEGVDLVFRARQRRHLFLHDVRIEPHNYGMELKLPEGTPVDLLRAHEIASGLQRQLRERGYSNPRVAYALEPAAHSEVDLRLKVDTGEWKRQKREKPREIRACVVPPPTLRMGRLDFTGNHHYSDATVRRYFLLDEGDWLDERYLAQSIARLNRAGMFEPAEVSINRDPAAGVAQVTVRLTERKGGWWGISGPVGPIGFAGPLRVSIQSRLPYWSSLAVSVGIAAMGHPLLPIVNAPKAFAPVLALQRPYTGGLGWTSGFALAPQLGWRGMALGYGSTQLQERLAGVLTPDPVPCGKRPRLHLLRGMAMMAIRVLGAM